MDANSDSNEFQTLGNSEESPDSHQNENSVKDNAWLHLKTITTFNTEFLIQKDIGIGDQYHSPKINHESHVTKLCKLHGCVQEANAENICEHQTKKTSCGPQMRNFFHTEHHNSKSSQFQETIVTEQLSNTATPDERVLRSCQSREPRRRRQSNSFSEGHNPYSSIVDPQSHFSVYSDPHRNGTMSDIGVNHTTNSMKSCTPAPVHSLTRFSPTSLLVESLIDQLCKLMEKDNGKQKKLYHVICERLHQMKLIDDTYNIEEFQFMRSHYQKALYQLLAVAKSSTQSPTGRNILLPLPSSNMNVDLKLGSEQVLEWSRYQHEYQELEYIAKGGFGHVYKARNKLDGGEYAIKKIFLRYRCVEGFLRSLKEVKMLARLNHPNIVSYKAAWLEPLDDNKRKAQMHSSPSSESNEASMSIVSVNPNSQLPLPPFLCDNTEDSLDIVFQDSSPDHKSDRTPRPNNIQLTSTESCGLLSKSPNSSTQHLSSCLEVSVSLKLNNSNSPSSCHHSSSSSGTDTSGSTDDAAVCPINAKESTRGSPSSTALRNWATLYVQMHLCERTLRQWLDVRNVSLPAYPLSPNSNEGILALNLFRKIVRGVDYIHTQGIVHHDIKPSNIFVNSNLKEVQVGDFGLSCCILSRVDSTGVVGEHHGEVGTRMYAAPEQLRGKCTSKSDLFSLGIVFIELLQPFHTDMERSKVIQGLRMGQLPPELSTIWPHAARLMTDLLTPSPVARPTAHELLQRVESLLRANVESDLHSQLALKDETIQLLKEAVTSRDQEIAELRYRLSLFEKKMK